MPKVQLQNLTGTLVQVWFIDALQGKSTPAPSLDACNEMAKKLLELAEMWKTYEPAYPELGRAGEYARNFLNHLPAAQAHSEKLRDNAHGMAAIQADFQRVLDAAENAEKAINHLLSTCDWATKPHHSWHGLTHHIRANATIAWLNSGLDILKVPRSVNPDDPMCQIVTSAINVLGVARTSGPISPEAVSDALRGRRGRPKLVPGQYRLINVAKQATKKGKKGKLS